MNPVLEKTIFMILRSIQGSTHFFRKRGFTGTSEKPILFNKEDRVPWWVDLVFSFVPVEITFIIDVETFWENGEQHVYPLWHPCTVLIDVSQMEGSKAGTARVLISGAPTHLHFEPRNNRPKAKAKKESKFGLGFTPSLA